MHGMIGSRSSLVAFSLSALTIVLAPSMASASTHGDKAEHADKAERPQRTARVLDSHGCSKPSVEVVAGSESATFPLERCDGTPIPGSVEKLSVLARPASAAKPKEPLAANPQSTSVAPGIRRIDPRLAERLELVAAHFRKDGEATRIILVAPKSRSAGSYHASGRAIDFRIEGAENETVAAFCKTIQDTGCGFYPNGGFVHMDVRDSGAGHVAWIDISKAGETPKYVSSWPLPGDAVKSEGGKVEMAKAETAKTDAPKAEMAKCEVPKAETQKAEIAKVDAAKPEAAKESASADESKLPSLPAAVQVAPMETPVTVTASEPAPAKKTHRHHRRSHSDHTI